MLIGLPQNVIDFWAVGQGTRISENFQILPYRTIKHFS